MGFCSSKFWDFGILLEQILGFWDFARANFGIWDFGLINDRNFWDFARAKFGIWDFGLINDVTLLREIGFKNFLRSRQGGRIGKGADCRQSRDGGMSGGMSRNNE